jgi:subtilisin-like proprotein convertase family protein
VCTLSETLCNDGFDNDADTLADLADPDCSLAAGIPPCNAGEALYVYNSVDVPQDVLDMTTTTSDIASTHTGVVQRAAVRLTVAHTYDADLDISLVSPAGTTVNLSRDNGGANDNYTDTILDSACPTSITMGTAPFTGCFSPEQSLSVLNGEDPDGFWALSVYDDTLSDVGMLVSWSLAVCVSP